MVTTYLYLQSGDTALHFASREGRFNIVQLLTKAGADVTIMNKVSSCMCIYIAS